MKYRSIFISDVHLGLPHTNLELLLEVLKNNEFENLFLVGDIIDGWKLKRKFEWSELENRLIQKIFKLARHGVKVHYIIGNHDEFLYSFENQSFGGIEVKERCIHTTNTGEKILIIHGHQFDGVVKCNKWLQRIGSTLYEWLLRLNVNFNILRHKLGMGYWSISKYLKSKTKEAVNYVSSFEDTLIDYAKSQGANSIVCGHIHTPKIVKGEINYYNTGDFVENASYLVETLEGKMHLIEL
ncbi:MAG: UDP-2,3-diacylglucosamine diphosphatase [bacterium]